MGPIKLKTWITWAVILFVLGVLADYYFLHILFKEKQDLLNGAVPAATSTATPTPSDKTDEEEMKENPPTLTEPAGSDSSAETPKDNFLESLKKCSPEIAAQAVATPEALIEYLKKSIGVKSENVDIENFHVLWKDGSKRRIHVVGSDNTNSKTKKDIKFFKVDAEGYPDPVALRGDETLEALLAQGKVEGHEVKSQLMLKDGGAVALEMHDNLVFEFQYNHQGRVLSCRFKECQCP